MSVGFKVDSDIVTLSRMVKVLDSCRNACHWDVSLVYVSFEDRQQQKQMKLTPRRYFVELPLA